jgi:DNA helicase II / ATP-dependent DNA helicase PcrA
MHVNYAQGPLGSGKTHWLCQQLLQWPLQPEGRQPGQWLLLASNSMRKTQWLERLQRYAPHATAERSVYTYTGWVRTMLFDYWPRVEARLNASAQSSLAQSVILPELCSYRDSEYLLLQLVQQLKHKQPSAFVAFPGGEAALIRQLLRRLRQRSENRLTRADMRSRSEFLAEPALDAVQWVEHQFDALAYQLRLLDPSKQLDAFHGLLAQDAWFLAQVQQRVQCLAIDDWDESTPAQQAFVRLLQPAHVLITCDPEGGSRRGYLNAYPYDWNALQQRWPGTLTTLTRQDDWHEAASTLLTRWKSPPNFLSSKLLSPDDLLSSEPDRRNTFTSPHYQAMVATTMPDGYTQLGEWVKTQLASGLHAGQLAIACPTLSASSQYALQQALQGVAIQWLSGTQTAWQHPVLRVWVLLLQWLNMPTWQDHPQWQTAPLTHMELADILQFWQNPLAQQAFTLEQLHQHPSLQAWVKFQADMDHRPFEAQLLPVFRQFIAPFTDTVNSLEPLTTLYQRVTTRFLPSYYAFNSANATGNELPAGLAWLLAVKQGHIAENPKTPVGLDPDRVIIGTPQKLIDANVKRDTLIWWDVANPDWHRSDNAPLYDAWVHSAAWQDGLLPELAPVGLPQDEWLVRVRAGHITRTLLLLCQRQWVTFTVENDMMNRPQTGLLPSLLPHPDLSTTALKQPDFTLRPDQAAVLNYTQGSMAISAVPGAGKTFVLVALIVNLIQQKGYAPEKMLVLTFMDSAAKNLTSRLRPYLGHALPHISTIHSLAYRIVRHGNHAHRLGLEMDTLQIIDDITQEAWLLAAAEQTLPLNANMNAMQWAKTLKTGLSRLKAHGHSLAQLSQYAEKVPDDELLQAFQQAVDVYQTQCKAENALDFNDLIQLSIQLLTEHDDIRQFYQQQVSLIIEDEAQDSSAALQTLLNLLVGNTTSESSPNIIRTGDTNQSITTTFSAADPQVFRQFIKHSTVQVNMTASGRCAQPIMDLANHWVSFCQHSSVLAKALVSMPMQAVPGFNPDLIRPLMRQVFDTHRQEEHAVLDDISYAISLDAISHDADSRKALLLCHHSQIKHWMGLLTARDIPCVASTVPPLLDVTLNTLFAWVQVVRQPDNAEAMQTFLTAYQQSNPAVGELLEQWAHDANALASEREALSLEPFTGGVLWLKQCQHPLALQLYYDWLDHRRTLLGKGPWLSLMGRQLFATAQAQQIIEALADICQAQLAYLPDPSAWLCEQALRLREQVCQKLKRLQDGDIPPGHILLTTLHSAKGQEYDWVWMPEMTDYYYPHTLEHIKANEHKNSMAIERRLMQMHEPEFLPPPIIENRLRQEKLEEQARLVYVGLTRAKKSLWLSAYTQGQKFNRTISYTPHPIVSIPDFSPEILG